MTTYYRIQTADRDVAQLLATDNISRQWNGDEDTNAQAGVSVCESIEALATYLATDGEAIPYGVGEWVVVELEGDFLGYGQDAGELLVQPTAIVSVAPMGDDLFDLIGSAYDAANAA